MKRILSIITMMGLFIFSNVNTKAMSKDQEQHNKYVKLCSSTTSYFLNKKECDAFKKTNATYFKSNITKVSNDDQKQISEKEMQTMIENNEKLIKQLQEKKDNYIADNAKKQILIENHLQSLEYKVLVATTSNFNKTELGKTITKLKKEIKENRKQIKLVNTKLTNTQKQINKEKAMLLEIVRANIQLYDRANENKIGTYNQGLDKVDLRKIEDKHKDFLKPVKHATITTDPWYYPADFGSAWHPGTDFAVDMDTKILAPFDGVLLSASSMGSGDYGNYLVIATKKDNFVYTIIFGHLDKFKANVTSFKQGDVIGYTGNTGASSGPHLHMEIFKHNTSDLNKVVNEFKKYEDAWFGLTYQKIGDKDKVIRLSPSKLYNVSVGQSF